MKCRLSSVPETARDRRFAFLLPSVLWAVFAALAPLPMLNRLALGDEVMPIAALVGQVSKWFFHPWMDDYPATTLIMVMTVASGLFWYRLLRGMEVMAGKGATRFDG